MHNVILGLLLLASLTAGAQNAEKEKAERQNAATTLLPTADNQLMQRSLNGTWKFRLVDGGTLPTALSDWQKSDWEVKDWSDINVPGCWETQGFCTASYGKTVPERHGLYRKKFVCPKEWRQKGNRIFLRIEISDCGDLFVDFIVTAPSGAPIHERTLPVGKCADYASLLTNLQCDKQYNIKVERDGRVVISHKKHGEMVNSPLLLRIDRPLTTTGVHRPGTKSRWSEYILKPQVMDVSTKKMLRLRANLFWPAMHRCSIPFYLVDGNREMADRYGITIGTSHCEPMLCNVNGEWNEEEQGEYDYVTNRDRVLGFWEKRVKETARSNGIYTLGMRGKHDSGMEGVSGIDQQKQYLQQVIDDQRALLKKHSSRDVAEIPQVFIPYKEVLDIYKAGIRVPDDVTLLWCDDNYGYIRHLPDSAERKRKGGNGVYYHFSYWGRP